ncbi:proteasome regulatory particle lid subunit RPN6 [Sugiyamaella lignohabitans]|uniref:Proteasome regulatory particle lid subunit RPN6 n=1 Tax=Sugiyamaella lignohabitans TaxID=796027 RepID=A0A167D8S6_9ASCO|nr:proteasome regulatory particle lid subunit RPN6 [Sugiyamaella lignohabitans]ANB12621.1 proteasome regulatory particle lid subunit RPN6 [Sugiyamaella lignohabitans]
MSSSSTQPSQKSAPKHTEKENLQILHNAENQSGASAPSAPEVEAALYELGRLYASESRADELAQLVAKARTIVGGSSAAASKSKAAKIIRNLIDLFDEIAGVNPGAASASGTSLTSSPQAEKVLQTQIDTTLACVDWAVQESRNFLRQSLQTRLVALYLRQKSYPLAIQLTDKLMKELKRLDDKMMLVEVQLLEAKVYHALRNIPKSKACLTSARTTANGIYCPPATQASLDNMSGVLQAEDKDYKTAFSYFYEAFEGYAGQDDDENAVIVLKYLLLCKIMLNLTDDMDNLLATSKSVHKYANKGGREIDAMKAIARAHSNRSLKEFELVLESYGPELSKDPFVRSHFSALYDTLLEQNLVKVIEPFSCVEISHIAELIGLDTRQIEGKLSQMILDKIFYGVLDQGNGWLFVYDEPQSDKTYDLAIDTIKHMSTVVDLLYDRAAALN